ncbi:hypothetical protein CZ809_00714 [Photobacterium piscicola]|uniref:Uncharacterized protein n=1 Tax=Photobacterium piscicola TaxID=1378299 RepID=A0A1T5HX05_9GAMM|nr:hypothetical protein CZ809_00714 [Photobacterium piscicola]
MQPATINRIVLILWQSLSMRQKYGARTSYFLEVANIKYQDAIWLHLDIFIIFEVLQLSRLVEQHLINIAPCLALVGFDLEVVVHVYH